MAGRPQLLRSPLCTCAARAHRSVEEKACDRSLVPLQRKAFWLTRNGMAPAASHVPGQLFSRDMIYRNKFLPFREVVANGVLKIFRTGVGGRLKARVLETLSKLRVLQRLRYL